MTTTGIDWSTLLKETSFDRAVDPYFVWADMTDFVGYFESAPDKDTNIPFLVESKISPPPKTEFNTATFKLKDVWGSLVNVSATVRWQFGQARTAYFRVETKRFVPDTARVVAAVLDDGCPFFNQTYTETSLPTSVKWLWHQGRDWKANLPYWNRTSPVPTKFLYGVELEPTAFQNVAARHATEDDRYSALGYLTAPGSDTHGDVWKPRYHGASVLSQVSGNPSPDSRRGSPLAPNNDANWPTVFVQFPSIEPFDTTGGWLGLRVYDGLLYVLDRARRGFALPDGVDSPVPVVACISYGGLAGPHDGTSMLERAIISLLERNKHLRIVLPSGNGFDRAIHAVAKADLNDPATFSVFVPPDCPHPCFVEIWLPEQIHPQLKAVSIVLSAPSQGSTLKLSGTGAIIGANGTFGIVLSRRVAQGQSGSMILVAIQATRTPGVGSTWRGKTAQAGVWQISIAAPACTLHAWIERDDVAGKVPRAQQARFVGESLDPSGAATPKAQIDERSTLSSIANAVHERLYIVGSTYVFAPAKANGVSPYSASGPSIAKSPRTGPDLSARSDVAPSLAGVMVDGVRSGDRYRSSGTSVAAGIAARYLLKQISIGAHVPPASPSPFPRLGTNVP